MANAAITQFSALTSVDKDDVVAIVDDPSGSAVTKKITVRNLVPSGINGVLFKILSSDVAGSNVNTAQPWFPSAGGVSVEGSMTYEFEGLLYMTRSAGSNSHTTSLLFGGTATLTSLLYEANVITGDTGANSALNATISNVATATVVKAASTSTTEVIAVYVRGTVRVNDAGTFIPQFQYSAAPGGAPTVKANSFFKLWPIGDNTVTTRGTWA